MSTDTADMGCDEVEAMLPLVADGVLDADGDPALFAHLERCPACQDSLARHDLVSLALARVPHAPPRRLQRIQLPLPQAFGTAAALACAGLLTWTAFDTPAHPGHLMTIPERTALEPNEIPPQAIDGIPSESAGDPAARTGDAAAAAETEGPADASAQLQPQPPFIVLQDGQSIVIPEDARSESRPPLTHPVGSTAIDRPRLYRLPVAAELSRSGAAAGAASGAASSAVSGA